jgi:hypothetical protein
MDLEMCVVYSTEFFHVELHICIRIRKIRGIHECVHGLAQAAALQKNIPGWKLCHQRTEV